MLDRGSFEQIWSYIAKVCNLSFQGRKQAKYPDKDEYDGYGDYDVDANIKRL